MTELALDLALRAAVNVLRDSVEAGRMPSGQPLTAEAADLHARAADRLELLARERVRDDPVP